MPHFREGIFIAFLIVLIVALGGLYLLYGRMGFENPNPISLSTPASSTPSSTQDGIDILAHDQAAAIYERVNYRVTSQTQLDSIWQPALGTADPQEPTVNFDTYEVFAIFDGSHSTGGYDVTIDSVRSEGGERVIEVTHREPGESCSPEQGATSPFIIVRVKRTDLPVSFKEATESTFCRKG